MLREVRLAHPKCSVEMPLAHAFLTPRLCGDRFDGEIVFDETFVGHRNSNQSADFFEVLLKLSRVNVEILCAWKRGVHIRFQLLELDQFLP